MNSSAELTTENCTQFLKISWLVYGFSMSFSLAFNRVGFILLLLSLIFFTLVNKKHFSFSLQREGATTSTLLLLFFLGILISGLLFPSEQRTASSVISFYLLFPIFSAIGFVSIYSRSPVIFKDRFLKGFLVGNLVAGFCNIAYAFFRSIEFKNGLLSFDSSVWGNTPWLVSVNNFGNYFYSEHFSSFLHPTYASIYLELSLVYVLYLLGRKEIRLLVALGLLAFIMLNIYLHSSRISILCVLLIFVFFIYNFRGSINKWLIVGSLVMVIAMTLLNPRSLQLLENHVWSEDLRFRAWVTSIEVIKQSGFWGSGIRNVSTTMQAQYIKFGFQENASMNLNCHNQFLEIFVATGFLGFLVFSLMLVTIWRKGYQQNDFLLIVFATLFTVHSLVESTLNRNQGIVLFLTFYVVLGLTNNRKSEESQKII